MSVRLLTSPFPSGLPNPRSPLVGRAREIEEAIALLADSSIRLLTLTGPGGTGKTRLAVRIAADVSDDFADGVIFAPLAVVRDPDLVLPAIAQAAGLAEPASGTIEAALTEFLANRNALLVLDNFEQISDAALAIARVLEHAPDVKTLVTSRVPLQISGEQRFPVAPLPLPDHAAASLDAVRQSDAVELFLQRARAIRPTMTLTEKDAPIVAEICRQLDGLPLALELAAARTNVLSLPALLARLTDRLHLLVGNQVDMPERLRTMRQAIAWSYDLLTPVEQSIFRRASVFSGGARLEALEAVANADALPSHEFLDCLGRLVDHSLMRREDGIDGATRIAMLETLREYGLEQLRGLDEEREVRTAHAACILAFVEGGVPRLIGHGQSEWMNEVDAERANIRAALAWSEAEGDVQTVLRFAAALWRPWTTRAGSEEGHAVVGRALDANVETPAPARLGGLIAAGFLAEHLSDYAAAWARFDEAATLAEATGDRLAQAKALDGMGTVAANRGDFDVAAERHERAAEIGREIGNERMIAVATANLGSIAYRQIDFDRAERCWLECRAAVRRQGDLLGEGVMTGNLGALAVMRGDLAGAEVLLSEALAIHCQHHDLRSMAGCLINIGDIRKQADDLNAAASCFDESLALYREIGDARGAAHAQVRVAKIAHALGDVAASRAGFTESVQALVVAGDRFGLMEAIDELALLLVKDRDARTAAKLYGLIEALHEELGSPRREAELPDFNASMTMLRSALGTSGLDELLAAGRQMTPPELTAMVAGLPRPSAPVSAPVRDKPAPRLEPERPRLSDRERDVLRLVATGCSNREIADALFISPRTASTHVEHILGKLNVNSRSAAVAVAMREGLV